MRGSTPLDVAAASAMDNNQLALALTEPDLEKVNLTVSLSLSRVHTCTNLSLCVNLTGP